MSLKKQHKPHPSINRSNDMFIRPSAPQIAQMNRENPDKKVTIADFDPEVKLNHFGEPAFIQPNRTVQARMKMGTTIPKVNKQDSAIQKMPDEDQEVQAKAKNDSPSAVQSSNTEGKSQTKNKTGMPSSLKSGLEGLSGEDLSGVRVHRNSSKPDEIGAHAYAQGEDIYLGQGQEKHLPHEGWHVVQQKQGRVRPTLQQKSKLINNDAGLEKEADVMGEKAASNGAVQAKSRDKTRGTSTIQLKPANGVVQLKPDVDSDYGKFKHTNYTAEGTKGAMMELEFHPDKTKVDAEKIGFTQTVISDLGGNSGIIHPTQKEREVKTGSAKGKLIDRNEHQGNPLYASRNPAAADKLGDTATEPQWGQHATKKPNGDWDPAKMIDRATRPGHQNNSSQEFETTALAVEGKQAGLYMGSVKWGWTYGSNEASFKLINFDLVSAGDPTSDFFDAAKVWNKAHTAGTFFVKGSLNGGTEAQVYKNPNVTSGTVKNNTVVKVLDDKIKKQWTHVYKNNVYAFIEYAEKPGGPKLRGMVKMDDLFDKGDGTKTIDLPVTWTGTIINNPKAGDANFRPGNNSKTGVYGDPLPVGTKVKVIDDSTSWLKVQIDPTQAGVILNASGTAATGGDGKIIAYVYESLVKK